MNATTDGQAAAGIEFFFDPMCPFAYQSSIWIRDVRRRRPLDITWRFFSLEEINRPEGKRHPWERPIAYGWTPMRVGAWLRRRDMDLCDRWYAVCGKALHEDGRRFYDPDVARSLLERIGVPPKRGTTRWPTRRRTTTSSPTTATPPMSTAGSGCRSS